MRKTCLIFALVMLVGIIAACGNNPVEQPATTTVTEPATTESAESVAATNNATEPPEYSAYRDWQYFVDVIGSCDSEEAGRVLVAMSNLSKRKLHVFAKFLENPAITEEFMDDLDLLNCYHEQAARIYEKTKDDVVDLYFAKRNGEKVETEVTVVDYWIMSADQCYSDGEKYNSPAMVELDYMSIWCPGQLWNADSIVESYYKGTYELSPTDSNGCPLQVVWHQNIMTPDGQDDTATDTYRQYQVQDPNQDAYIVVACDHSFMMIHIIPVSPEA